MDGLADREGGGGDGGTSGGSCLDREMRIVSVYELSGQQIEGGHRLDPTELSVGFVVSWIRKKRSFAVVFSDIRTSVVRRVGMRKVCSEGVRGESKLY
ncbi:hypothetical protein M0804_001693 [Polistes exclamans]|nr:hypothetical protein M0804_001693 [Polistes exclamans]